MQVEIENVPDNTQSPLATVRSDQSAMHLAIASRFNIDTPTQEEENKLSEIWAHAQGKAGTENIQDIIWEIINLESTLGAPRLGESRLDKMYKYAKLRRQEAQIQADLRNVSGSANLYR